MANQFASRASEFSLLVRTVFQFGWDSQANIIKITLNTRKLVSGPISSATKDTSQEGHNWHRVMVLEAPLGESSPGLPQGSACQGPQCLCCVHDSAYFFTLLLIFVLNESQGETWSEGKSHPRFASQNARDS